VKAIAQLVGSYFASTRLTGALTFGGLALMAGTFVLLLTSYQSAGRGWFAVLGYIMLFLGTALMPLTFGRLARSHAIRVLPYGRVKLLLSGFITVALIALPPAIITPLTYATGVSTDTYTIFTNPDLKAYVITLSQLMYTFMVLVAGWLYLAMYFITSQRSIGGVVKGLLVILILIYAPSRQIQDLSVSVRWNLIQIAIVWGVFAAGFLLLPRWSILGARLGLHRFAEAAHRLKRNVAGREIDLILGTANPWLLIAAQLVPILIVGRAVAFEEAPSVWLFYLTLFSTVSGAIAGQAAERSRALWLRGNWSREALFSEVERSFWRHNSYVLGALIAFMVAVGSYAQLPARILIVGLPLLALGTLLSTYLGLMLTRGLRWPESLIAIVIMLALMAGAALAAKKDDSLVSVFALEAGLAIVALVLRSFALKRWTRIDWMLCRPDRAWSLRGAS
jgi:hypothetical protein